MKHNFTSRRMHIPLSNSYFRGRRHIQPNQIEFTYRFSTALAALTRKNTASQRLPCRNQNKKALQLQYKIETELTEKIEARSRTGGERVRRFELTIEIGDVGSGERASESLRCMRCTSSSVLIHFTIKYVAEHFEFFKSLTLVFRLSGNKSEIESIERMQ